MEERQFWTTYFCFLITSQDQQVSTCKSIQFTKERKTRNEISLTTFRCLYSVLNKAEQITIMYSHNKHNWLYDCCLLAFTDTWRVSTSVSVCLTSSKYIMKCFYLDLCRSGNLRAAVNRNKYSIRTNLGCHRLWLTLGHPEEGSGDECCCPCSQ